MTELELLEARIKLMKSALEILVEKEKYETAISFRDTIRELEEELETKLCKGYL